MRKSIVQRIIDRLNKGPATLTELVKEFKSKKERIYGHIYQCRKIVKIKYDGDKYSIAGVFGKRNNCSKVSTPDLRASILDFETKAAKASKVIPEQSRDEFCAMLERASFHMHQLAGLVHSSSFLEAA